MRVPLSWCPASQSTCSRRLAGVSHSLRSAELASQSRCRTSHTAHSPLWIGEGAPGAVPFPCEAPPGSAAAGMVRAGLQGWHNSGSKSWVIQAEVLRVARGYFGSVADHRCARSPVGGGSLGSLLRATGGCSYLGTTRACRLSLLGSIPGVLPSKSRV